MKTYKWLRGLMKASALTTVMFIMQACYGTPKNEFVRINISGYVTDKSNGQPLQGIQLEAFHSEGDYDHVIGYTDENGYFEMSQWDFFDKVSQFTIEAVDTLGNYRSFDTLVSADSDLTDLKIKLEINQ
jgi:hypothetical protein